MPILKRLPLSRNFLHVCALLLIPAHATAAVSLTRTTSPSFGIILSGSSGREFVLNTDGSIGGSSAADYVSGAAAGVFSVVDTTSPNTLTIVVDSISATGGLTVVDALCSYNGATQQSCDGTGISVNSIASSTLRVGLHVTTTTAHSGGDTASVSMDVSVAYL